MLKLRDAVKTAEHAREVRDWERRGYYFNSAICLMKPGQKFPEEWILTYYNDAENKVVQATVSAEATRFQEASTPVKPTKGALRLADVKTTADTILKKAGKKFAEYKQPLSQVILTLQNDEDNNPCWHANFITKTLNVITVKINGRTGRITSSASQSLVKAPEQA